ncbi:MAG TPA: GAF domain-containing protein, partial [Stenomitos sp.]
MLLQRYSVLVVDDSPDDVKTFRRYLLRDQSATYDIHDFGLAAEALQYCQSNWPDLIILDYVLPDSNALRFIDQLQEVSDSQALPAIIVLTGQGNEEIAVALMKKGVQDYLNKNNLLEQKFQLAVQRALNQTRLRKALFLQSQWQQLLTEIALRIRQSLELTEILNATVHEVQQFLQCDRVLFYQFAKDWSGDVVAEAVRAPWKSLLGLHFTEQSDHSFTGVRAVDYLNGKQLKIDDIYNSELSLPHIQLLESIQARAVLVFPILVAETEESQKLWGLVVAHQCQDKRLWSENSVSFLSQLSIQIAIAIQQAELLQRLNHELAQRTLAEQDLRHQTTQQQWLIQELAKATTLLRQRNNDLDSFVSIASHDLRAPLRAVRNLAVWLVEDYADILNAEAQQRFALLLSRVDQMDALLSDLLQYARVGRVEGNQTAVDMTELLEQVIQSIDVPPGFNIRIDSPMPTLTTNPSALAQIFTNLVGNAV